MDFKALGDSAILINFEQQIDPRVNDQVIVWTKAIESAGIPAIQYCIPAYCSLTVAYDPHLIQFDTLCQLLKKLEPSKDIQQPSQNRTLRIPVCYEAPYALDWAEVEQQTGLPKSRVVELHSSTEFRVYMMGFIPGFTYMGTLPQILACQRKTTPRTKVPALSVGLAGLQTGIYPANAPGGWQIIGRTPIKVFDGDRQHPFLFKTGDRVHFFSISTEEFDIVSNAQTKGELNWEELYE